MPPALERPGEGYHHTHFLKNPAIYWKYASGLGI